MTAAVKPDALLAAVKAEQYRRDFPRFCREQLKIKPKPRRSYKPTGRDGQIEEHVEAIAVGSPPVPFTFNPSQQRMEAAAQAQLKKWGWIRQVCLKCRQPGGSTYWEARGFHVVSLNKNCAMLTIAQDPDTTGHIFGISRLYYDCLDRDIKPLERYNSKKELTFENPDDKTRDRYPGLRSRISFQTAKNIHSGTGTTNVVLHLSESAKYGSSREMADLLSASLLPSVPDAPGTIIVNESTAHTSGEWFHEQCERAQSGKDIYDFVFCPPHIQPEYQLPIPDDEEFRPTRDERRLIKHFQCSLEFLHWRRYKIQQFGGDSIAESLFNQEYPLRPEDAWISLGMGVFDGRILEELRRGIVPPKQVADIFPGPKMLDNPTGDLRVWEPPLPGAQYDIGVDTAQGLEYGDFSTMQVLQRGTREQVAEYRSHVNAGDLAPLVYALGQWYNWAHVGVEIDGIGFYINDALQKMGYPNLYVWRYRGRAVPTFSQHSGWETSNKSKKLLVSTTRHLLNHRQLPIKSELLLNEMRTFQVEATETSETYRAAPGKHDDLVMALLIAAQIQDDETFGMAMQSPEAAAPKGWQDPATTDDTDLEELRAVHGADRMIKELGGVK